MDYAWGNYGVNSIVYRLAGGRTNPHQPAAELWFGAHVKAPSFATIGGQAEPLSEILQRFGAQILGERSVGRFGVALPFLFKILSVRTALSIQAHPSPELARNLHTADQINYPDSSHKPELAIAISPVSLVCGFRSRREILLQAERTPCLANFLPKNNPESTELAGDALYIRHVYREILTASTAKISDCCRQLEQQLQGLADRSELESYLLELFPNFPGGDPGLPSLLVLRQLKLSPGEGIFIPPNTPHAYLYGELVECMANSDNVVRGGLTAKHCDIAVLLGMLEYDSEQVPIVKPSGGSLWSNYETPCAEFSVASLRSELIDFEGGGEGSVELLVCTEGVGQLRFGDSQLSISAGGAWIIPASIERYFVSGFSGTLFRVRIP